MPGVPGMSNNHQGENHDGDGFVMVYPTHMRDVLEFTRDRLLQPRDSAVLIGMIAHVDGYSGKARVSPNELARLLGMEEGHVYLSIKRLRNCRLAARYRNPRTDEVCFVLNPELMVAGNRQRQGHLRALFEEALELAERRDAVRLAKAAIGG